MTEPSTETAAPRGPDGQGGGAGRRGVITAAVLGAVGLGIAGAAKALSLGSSTSDAAATSSGSARGATPSSTVATPSTAPSASASGTGAASGATGPAAVQTADSVDLNQSYQRTARRAAATSEHLTYPDITPAPVETSASTTASSTPTVGATAITSTPVPSATSSSPSASTSVTTPLASASTTIVSSAPPSTATPTPTTTPTRTAPTAAGSTTPSVTGPFSAAAAKATQPATVFGPAGALTNAQAQAHLLRRATWGARPGDRTELATLGIDGWLNAQLNPTSIADPVGDAAIARFLGGGTTIPQVIAWTRQYSWNACFELGAQALVRQIYSKRQLFEVVVDTISNLLNVTMPSDSVWATGPDFHYSVIRTHAFGSYRQMLLAAMKHPAMLTYLNNNESERDHVNENLGRELLELHTVGVTGGYTEDDVKGSAKILSGRTIEWNDALPTYQQYVYNPDQHYIGPVTVMGFSDPNTDPAAGEALCDRYVSYLAGLRQTGIRLARKLALRLVSDAPSDALIAAMADAYMANDTQIVPMLRVVFSSVEFWSSVGAKTKRPTQDFVSTMRALDYSASDPKIYDIFTNDLYWEIYHLGDGPFLRVPPDGYPDVAAAWQGAGQVIQRWEIHRERVYGWSDFTPTLFPVTPVAGQTVGQWVDQMSLFLLGGILPASARATLFAFLKVAEGADATYWETADLGGDVASLILDSIYFEAR